MTEYDTDAGVIQWPDQAGASPTKEKTMGSFNLFGKFLGFGGWKAKLTAILGATSVLWWPPLAAATPDQYEPAILMMLGALGITGIANKLEKADKQNVVILKSVGVPIAKQETAVDTVDAEKKEAGAK